jgi:hypothetical protein
MSGEQVTDLSYNGSQERYHAIRRRQAEEVAKIVPTAKPWPKAHSGLYGWKIRPDPGTLDDSELTDV